MSSKRDSSVRVVVLGCDKIIFVKCINILIIIFILIFHLQYSILCRFLNILEKSHPRGMMYMDVDETGMLT